MCDKTANTNDRYETCVPCTIHILFFWWSTHLPWFYGSASIQCDWALGVSAANASARFSRMAECYTRISKAFACMRLMSVCMRNIESRDWQIFEQLITILTAKAAPVPPTTTKITTTRIRTRTTTKTDHKWMWLSIHKVEDLNFLPSTYLSKWKKKFIFSTFIAYIWYIEQFFFLSKWKKWIEMDDWNKSYPSGTLTTRFCINRKVPFENVQCVLFSFRFPKDACFAKGLCLTANRAAWSGPMNRNSIIPLKRKEEEEKKTLTYLFHIIWR